LARVALVLGAIAVIVAPSVLDPVSLTDSQLVLVLVEVQALHSEFCSHFAWAWANVLPTPEFCTTQFLQFPFLDGQAAARDSKDALLESVAASGHVRRA